MHWINNVLFAAAVAAAAVGGGSAMAGEENKNMNELPTPYVTVEGITEYRLSQSNGRIHSPGLSHERFDLA